MSKPTVEHIGLLVPDLEAAISVFTRIFGAGPVAVRALEDAGLKVAEFALANVTIEFLQYAGENQAFAKRVMGERMGVNHISLGVAGIAVAIVIDALAYKKLASGQQKTTSKGIVISVVAGVLMGLFYYLVQKGVVSDFVNPEAGKMGPYAAVFIFSLGVFLSSFIWNTIVMAKPFVGEPVPIGDYFSKGNVRLHIIGILGGVIWGIGMSVNNVAAGTAAPAISYGLGQGATMIAALWGVFIWREFKSAPAGTNKLLNLMFVFYAIGLGLIITARIV